MAIKDIVKNLQKAFRKQDVSTYGAVESGNIGTALFSGLLDVEFNSDLAFPDSLDIYDKMRKSDATVQAVLEAVKSPLLSAKHYIEPGGRTKRDEQLAEFINEAMFERIDFAKFLNELVCYYDFGFYYFEKIHKVDEDGVVWWDRFAPRVPSAHYKWQMQSNEKWIDGHPSGITQQLPGKTDDVNGEKNQPEIPWNKLILFVNKQEGNNYEGVSLLRSAYKHWFYKDLLYKIQGISAERFGCGIPWAKHPAGVGAQVEAKLDELLENIRTNEQAYARTSKEIELEILTPKGDPKAGAIDNAIAHHDRKIYDSILAGFLNLSTGEGGSNALSKDQSSFFLRAQQYRANYIESVINPHIRELIDMNFQGVEHYPKYTISDIGQISLDETINAIATAKEKGLVTITAQDEVSIRGILHLPSRTIQEIQKDKEMAKEEKKEEVKNNPIMPPEEEEKEEKKEEVRKQAEVKKKPKPTQREVEFTKHITEFENYLESEYKDVFLPILGSAENKYRKALTIVYNGAETERIDGVVVLARSSKNNQLKNKAITAVNAITKQLSDKLLNSPLQERLFMKTKSMAINNLKNNEKLLAEIHVDEGQFNSFISGYKSNIMGVLFNEPRRIAEDIILNFGSQVSIELAIKQAEGISFNKNIFKLSAVTHARAAYSNIIVGATTKEGFTMFKVLVPKNKLKEVSPSGRMAMYLFGIYTIAQLNKRANEEADGKNAAAAGGLGLHHNSYEQYYPVESEKLDEEIEIAKEQKREWENMVKNN